MKKALILAYDFPPYNSVGGQRPYSWFKYLNEFDVHCTVVTRHWDQSVNSGIDYIKPSVEKSVSFSDTGNGRVVRVPFKPNFRDQLILKFGMGRFVLLRKILTIVYSLTEFLFAFMDNRWSIYQEAKKELSSNNYDCIIATGEPFILFRYASLLSKKYDLPWIADYRDGWSTNYNRSRFEKWFYGHLERRMVLIASYITVASFEFKQQLESKFHFSNIAVVRNGYFPEYFDSLTFNQHSDFTLSFAGTLYGYQPIELLSDALSKCNFCDGNVKLNFYGLNYYPDQKLRVENAFLNCPVDLNFTDRLPHNVVLTELAQSSLLLLPASPAHPQIYAKVFDYLALKRKVLLFRSDKGALEEILNNTNSGIICDTAEEIAEALENCYAEWQKTGTVKCESRNIEQYSRREQTKKLAELIKSIC